jgi:hypothetical protein
MRGRKEISVQNLPEVYENSKVEVPKTLETKKKWLSIYEDYTIGSMTMTQIAEERGLNLSTIKNAVKWVALQEGNLDKSTDKGAIESRLQQTLGDLSKTLEKARYTFSPKRMMKYLTEIQELLSAEDDIIHAEEILREAIEYFQQHAFNRVDNELKVRAEIRQTVKMLAQTQRVLGSDSENTRPGNVIVQVNMPKINRGLGVASAIEIEGEVLDRPVAVPG